MTDQLYNPGGMSEDEIRGTLAPRYGRVVDELARLTGTQPEGAGVQHAVILAPRGMGKTTVLIMLELAVRDQELNPPWLAVRFPEELYGVTDLADFWLETLRYVANLTGDDGLARDVDLLPQRHRETADLAEAALGRLRMWCRENGRRLLLLVDNFDLVLSQVADDQQEAALRRELMNQGSIMLVGAAPTMFEEIREHDRPLFNFFRVFRLERLNPGEIRELLLNRAKADNLAQFERLLAENSARIQALAYFTGGNTRLVLMLYRVLAHADVVQVTQSLQQLIDQVTPYYKDRTESLPAQQRKILDCIARKTGETRVGISPSQIAGDVRLTAQVVSSQLKRLLEAGFVLQASQQGRSTYYTLSEPLYALWYQMRFGRTARQKMAWLVEFLKGFYSFRELEDRCEQLDARKDLEGVRSAWVEAQKSGRDWDGYVSLATGSLLAIARAGEWPFVRELIAISSEPEQFFPITRALDYLGSGDETLLKNLSPEVKPLVREIVDSLGDTARTAVPSTKTRRRRRRR